MFPEGNYEEMKRDGHFTPDEIMYNSILDGCTKQRNVSEALRVLEEMKSSGIRPSNYTLSILVKLRRPRMEQIEIAECVETCSLRSF